MHNPDRLDATSSGGAPITQPRSALNPHAKATREARSDCSKFNFIATSRKVSTPGSIHLLPWSREAVDQAWYHQGAFRFVHEVLQAFITLKIGRFLDIWIIWRKITVAARWECKCNMRFGTFQIFIFKNFFRTYAPATTHQHAPLRRIVSFYRYQSNWYLLRFNYFRATIAWMNS